MTTAVLQAHHAVQTLPEVSPEFSQAIVQTDISGPITELANSELTHTDIAKSVAEAGLQDSEVAQDDTVMDSGTLDSHEDLTADIQMEGSCEKDVPIITQTGKLSLTRNSKKKIIQISTMSRAKARGAFNPLLLFQNQLFYLQILQFVRSFLQENISFELPCEIVT